MRDWRKKRGLGLVYVLLVLSLVSIMAVSVLTSVRGQLRITRQYAASAAARYAAEAGVALALSKMELDRGWRTGFRQQALASGRGTFTLDFATSGTSQSVNNLTGDDWVASFRGGHTVPPYTALLIVRGEVDGAAKTVEVLVEPGGGENVDSAAMISGRVRMKGSVGIQGWRTLAGRLPMEAGLHSNYISDEPGLVRYEGGGTVSVNGVVSSAGTSPQAVEFPAGVRTMYNAPVKPLPFVDIPATIAARRNLSPLALRYFDTNVTQLPAGDYYIGGDLNVKAGNLRLDNTKLYVSGNVSINGSIIGQGAVFVGGKTTLSGTTSVSTSDQNFVALYSHGSVHLQGFDYVGYYDTYSHYDGNFANAWWNGGARNAWESREKYDDSTGSAGFVGLVYTNGSVYAAQSVTIVGSVIVRDDGTQRIERIDDVDLAPGDLYLANGASLVYVEEFFKQGKIFRETQGLGVTSWVER